MKPFYKRKVFWAGVFIWAVLHVAWMNILGAQFFGALLDNDPGDPPNAKMIALEKIQRVFAFPMGGAVSMGLNPWVGFTLNAVLWGLLLQSLLLWIWPHVSMGRFFSPKVIP